MVECLECVSERITNLTVMVRCLFGIYLVRVVPCPSVVVVFALSSRRRDVPNPVDMWVVVVGVATGFVLL